MCVQNDMSPFLPSDKPKKKSKQEEKEVSSDADLAL